jgi:hypothetical protein
MVYTNSFWNRAARFISVGLQAIVSKLASYASTDLLIFPTAKESSFTSSNIDHFSFVLATEWLVKCYYCFFFFSFETCDRPIGTEFLSITLIIY